MRLERVEYEFFDFEDPSPLATELARQIRFVFSDALPVFLSWTWERQHSPDSQPYSIGWGEKSFFVGEPASVIDASKSPVWAKHLEMEVELLHIPSAFPSFEFQVLEVRSPGGHSFMCSFGHDKVRISAESPFPQDAVETGTPDGDTAWHNSGAGY
jgi:hypothetical protein